MSETLRVALAAVASVVGVIVAAGFVATAWGEIFLFRDGFGPRPTPSRAHTAGLLAAAALSLLGPVALWRFLLPGRITPRIALITGLCVVLALAGTWAILGSASS